MVKTEGYKFLKPCKTTMKTDINFEELRVFTVKLSYSRN